MKEKTKVITTHVPHLLAKKLDHFSQTLERSRGWIVKQAIRNWVERQEEQYRMTVEGLVEVDSGHLIDHRDVRSWVQSLGSKDPVEPPTI